MAITIDALQKAFDRYITTKEYANSGIRPETIRMNYKFVTSLSGLNAEDRREVDDIATRLAYLSERQGFINGFLYARRLLLSRRFK